MKRWLPALVLALGTMTMSARADEPRAPDEMADDGTRVVEASVKGAASLRVESLAGDVHVVAGAPGKVRLKVEDGDARDVKLVPVGENRFEASFDGRAGLRNGEVTVELPAGSGIEARTLSGDIRVEGVGGEVRVKSAAGDIRINGASTVDASSVSGSVAVDGATGSTKVRTISGDMEVTAASPAADVELETTSGDVRWRGACRAGCRLMARSLSGDVELDLDPSSSFGLRFITHTGDLASELPLVSPPGEPGDDAPHEHERIGTLGKGEGLVECRTFSGDLALKKR